MEQMEVISWKTLDALKQAATHVEEIIGDLDINALIARYVKKCNLAVDIGCGNGDLIPQMLEYADNVVGVDRSQKMLEQAKRLTSENSARITEAIMKRLIPLPKGKRLFMPCRIVSPVTRVYRVNRKIPINVKTQEITTVHVRPIPYFEPAFAMDVTLPVPIL